MRLITQPNWQAKSRDREGFLTTLVAFKDAVKTFEICMIIYSCHCPSPLRLPRLSHMKLKALNSYLSILGAGLTQNYSWS